MPPRYQQGQLASSLVGTPGVDPSAGKVEAEISATSAKAVEATQQAASQSFQQAHSAFNQADTQFTAIANRNQYYARLQNQAILQSQLEGMETKAKAAFIQIDSDIKTEFANNPDGALKAAQERGRDVLRGLAPETTDKRVAAMYATKGENAFQSFIGGVASWQPTQKTINEKIDFDAVNSELEKAATAHGAAGNFSKVMAIHAVLESPEYKSRAFKLGTAAENQRQRSAQNVLLNGIDGLGYAQPEQALKVSQELTKLGLVQPKEAQEIEGRLRAQQNVLHSLAEQTKATNIEHVKYTFGAQYGGDMQAAALAKNLPAADAIFGQALAAYQKTVRDGAPPEMQQAALTAVEHLGSERDGVRRASLEGLSDARGKRADIRGELGLQAQLRSNETLANNLRQATPRGIQATTKAYADMELAMAAFGDKGKALTPLQRQLALDTAAKSTQAAKQYWDDPYSDAPNTRHQLGQLAKLSALQADSLSKAVQNAKDPTARAFLAARASIGDITRDEDSIVTNAIVSPVDPLLMAAAKIKEPNAAESTLKTRRAIMLNASLANYKAANPDTPLTNADVTRYLKLTEQRLMKRLKEGK